eukprot:TRINITY_DN3676_c0_g1_i1.p1 TRINITY_DN3676_c0_g1~~TRINITY_DN3676_c0_g1_i1.p1  ORF type:complete len:552 (+),score=121.35 TRINITY_DN3676_c0_g1_i1:22-1656(+)
MSSSAGTILGDLVDKHLTQGLHASTSHAQVQMQVASIVDVLHQHSIMRECMTIAACSKIIVKWFKELRALLNSRHPSHRWAAAVLYTVTFDSITYEVMQTMLETSIQDFITVLHPKRGLPPSTYGPLVRAFGILIGKAARYSDTKRVAAAHIPAFLANILHPITEGIRSLANDNTSTDFAPMDADHASCVMDCFRALAHLMRTMGASVRPQLAKVEAMALAYLSVPYDACDAPGGESLRDLAADIIPLIPTCMSDRAYWTELVQKIVKEVDQLLNVLYRGLEDGDSKPDQPGEGPPLGACVRRVQSLVQALMRCLASSFPPLDATDAGVPLSGHMDVPMESLLQMICRILNVNITIESAAAILRDGADNTTTQYSTSQLLSVLPSLHMEAYALLDTLLSVLGQHCAPFHATLASLLLRPLQMQRRYVPDVVVIRAYTVMRTFLTLHGGSVSQVNKFISPLVEVLLSDVASAPSAAPSQMLMVMPASSTQKRKHLSHHQHYHHQHSNAHAAANVVTQGETFDEVSFLPSLMVFHHDHPHAPTGKP